MEEKAPINNQSSASVQQKDADVRLIELVSGQMVTVAREVNFLRLVILVLVFVLCISTAWNTWRLNRVEDMVSEQMRISEQVKKNIWELKTALKLKFSQERNGEE